MLGAAEVRQVFKLSKVGHDRRLHGHRRHDRRDVQGAAHARRRSSVWDGRIGSLKRFKDDVREVASGFECGIGLDGINDLKVGDVIEAYEIESKPARALTATAAHASE